jgi:predicted amidophosphoribosyltransferase
MNYYTDALERQYDYQEMCEKQEIEREKLAEAEATSCCPQCEAIDAAYTDRCDNCGKPIPLSEAGALCERCEAEQNDDTPMHLQLGELPHGGWRRS